LGKAGLAGFNTSQDVVDRALNTAYRNKLVSGRDDVFSNINPLDVTPESLQIYIEGGKKDPSVLRRATPAEKPQAPMIVSAGSTVYDPNSNEAKYTAPRERKTITVDGVVLDAETMKPLYKAPQKPESLYKPEVNAEGKVFFIPQKPNMPILDAEGKKVDNANLSTKPPTGEQSNAYVYSNRMESADKILNKLDGKYDPFLISIKTSGTTSLVPGGQTLANKALSASDQQAEQAQRNFINAVLRRESGAVISPSEFENASLQYFPQAGDTSEVKIQKASNRRLAIDDLKRISGKSYNAESKPSVVNFEDLK
jgi:hypothetical protein